MATDTEQLKQVDSKGPRGKAAFHTLLPAAAFLLGGPAGAVLVGATGAAMAVSVLAGPRYSVFGRLFGVIKEAFDIKPGKPEALAPHRFAEAIGAVFLLASVVALGIGAATVGWTLALIVVALAALNWLGGICVGCQMYLLIAKIRGKSSLATQ